MAKYEKTDWKYNDIIDDAPMNNIEDELVLISNNARNATLFKRGVTILFDWAYQAPTLTWRLIFYGASGIDFLSPDLHKSGMVLAGANFDFVDGAYICVDMTNQNAPSLVSVNTLDEVFTYAWYYIVGHFQYANGIESIVLNGTGLVPRPESGE